MAKRLLVVDDLAYIRILVTKALQKMGFDVMAAQSGAEAIRLTGTHDFDLVILDINLPDTGGAELLTQWREGGLKFPVVVMSGHLSPDVISSFAGLGVKSVLAKPVDVGKLREIIDGILSGSHSGRKEAIIVVDDDYKARVLLEKLLSRFGLEVALFSTGEDALSALGQFAPAGVVADLVLRAGMGGDEFILRLREILPEVPIVLVTGKPEREKIITLGKAGLSDIMVKPFENGEFMERIAKAFKLCIPPSSHDSDSGAGHNSTLR
ncbi:MAG: hypothetical protein CVV64_09940 [Candidatus Wallbacteria bacterium HGW-Wallbacteria-1]|jgi:DNA-binding response OmpR family regulator|uniref:Response regulatory domain-containing protein n=1 Tax=Candidatus Wallbacteria bacterium HGW-Wallbacteria-1 TaxID=2013854 RepID=A0A2N1PPK9_9BACT|nr:MAG: hypothetical protein CVV64_09940 [Candidatus Wallbacteria bacterium HGW-Wallbacteria-1]